MEILIKRWRERGASLRRNQINRILQANFRTYSSQTLTKLRHDNDSSLRFTEAICDFGSLIIEMGPDAVLKGFSEGYPMQCEQLEIAMEKKKELSKVPALFKKVT